MSHDKPETDLKSPIFTPPTTSPQPAPPPPCTCIPTVERLTPSGNPWVVTCDPHADITIVNPGGHPGSIVLPVGGANYFTKKIQMLGLNNGNVQIIPTNYGDGRVINILSSCPGAVILLWDPVQSMWLTTAVWDAQVSS